MQRAAQRLAGGHGPKPIQAGPGNSANLDLEPTCRLIPCSILGYPVLRQESTTLKLGTLAKEHGMSLPVGKGSFSRMLGFLQGFEVPLG